MGFPARAHDRTLKVARTIVDLDESERAPAKHLAEAVQGPVSQPGPELLELKRRPKGEARVRPALARRCPDRKTR
jgi:hypothetical protein